MPYRDSDPLDVREAALARELRSLEKREEDVRRALDDARAKRRDARKLPMLENVRVASPCTARWDDMTGDDYVRFCGSCAKNVYDLSSMTSDAAEALLASKGETPCVRFYRRDDGTILTSDCPVGIRRKRVRRVVAVAAGVGGLSAFAVAGLASMGKPTMGAIEPSAAQMEAYRARTQQGTMERMEQGETNVVVRESPAKPTAQPVTPSAPSARQSTPRR